MDKNLQIETIEILKFKNLLWTYFSSYNLSLIFDCDLSSALILDLNKFIFHRFFLKDCKIVGFYPNFDFSYFYIIAENKKKHLEILLISSKTNNIEKKYSILLGDSEEFLKLIWLTEKEILFVTTERCLNLNDEMNRTILKYNQKIVDIKYFSNILILKSDNNKFDISHLKTNAFSNIIDENILIDIDIFDFQEEYHMLFLKRIKNSFFLNFSTFEFLNSVFSIKKTSKDVEISTKEECFQVRYYKIEKNDFVYILARNSILRYNFIGSEFHLDAKIEIKKSPIDKFEIDLEGYISILTEDKELYINHPNAYVFLQNMKASKNINIISFDASTSKPTKTNLLITESLRFFEILIKDKIIPFKLDLLVSNTIISLENLDTSLQEKKEQAIPDEVFFELTPQTQNNKSKLEAAVKQKFPILIEGPPASGKTSLIIYYAFVTRSPLLRFNLTPNTTIEDLIGKIEISSGENNGIEFKPGIFTKALEEGYWLLLDEANLSPDSILRVIEDVLSTGFLRIANRAVVGHPKVKDGVLTIKMHDNFRLFLTQNPPMSQEFFGTRNLFSEAFLSHFVPIYFSPLDFKDLFRILKSNLVSANLENIDIFAKNLIEIFERVCEIQKKNNLKNQFTIRDLLQAGNILVALSNNKDCKISSLFSMKLLFTQNLKYDEKKYVTNLIDEKLSRHIKDNSQVIAEPKQSIKNLCFLKKYSQLFAFYDLCILTKRPGLVTGSRFSGKSSSFLLWLEIKNLQLNKNYKCEKVYLNKESNEEDLFGKICPSDTANVPFKWVDGPITRAIKQGSFVLLIGIQEPPPAILESLNSILEAGENRSILVNNELVKINDNFLIIATESADDFFEKKTPLSAAFYSRFLKIDFYSFISDEKDIDNMFRCYEVEGVGLNKEIIIKNCFRDDIDIGKFAFLLKSFKECILFLKNLNYQNDFIRKKMNESLESLISIIYFQQKKNLENLKLPISFKMLSKPDFDKDFVETASREKLLEIVSTCIASKLFIVFEGPPSVGKTRIVDFVADSAAMFDTKEKIMIRLSKNTAIQDLMGYFIPDANGVIKHVKGSLYKGIEDGNLVLLDEFNLANPEVLGFISNLLTYPGTFTDPTTGKEIIIHKNFRLYATQNPSFYTGRNILPKSVEIRSILIEVPPYTNEELRQIVKGIFVKLEEKHIEYLINLLNNEKKEENSEDPSKKITLRTIIKIVERAKTYQNFYPNFSIQDLLEFHAWMLCPDKILLKENPKASINIKNVEGFKFWVFEINSISIEYEIQNENKAREIEKKLKSLSEESKMVICKIAFAKFFKEPILIEGITSYKTFSVQVFSEMFEDFKCKDPLTIFYASPLISNADLVGMIEPHSKKSYEKYSQNICSQFYFDVANLQMSVDKLIEINKDNLPNQIFFKQIKTYLESKDEQFFPFCERNLSFSIRFGGIFLLKNINLADQAVIEGLNSLLELNKNRNFELNGEKIEIHKDFLLVATINYKNSKTILSPALKSRFTVIEVEPNNLISNNMIDLFMSYLQSEEYNITKSQTKEIIYFLKNLLSVLFEVISLDQITLRHIYKWLSFGKLKLKGNVIDKFIIGSKMVFLDQLSKQKQNDIINKLHNPYRNMFDSLINKFNPKKLFDGKYLNYLKLEVDNPKIEQDFYLTEATIKNIARILCARYTGQASCLIGPPGIGKTSIAEISAKIMDKPFIRISCSSNLTVEDLFGSFAPKITENEQMIFDFHPGILKKAIDNKSVILFDELNLAPSDVITALISIFTASHSVVKINDYLIDKKDVVFLCAMNGAEEGGGRKELPVSIVKLMNMVYLENFSNEDLKNIFMDKFGNNPFLKKHVGIVFDIHLHLKKIFNYDYNIRDLQNLGNLFNCIEANKLKKPNKFEENYLEILALILSYVEPLETKEKRKTALKIILEKFGVSVEKWQKRQIAIRENQNQIVFEIDFNPVVSFPKTPGIENNLSKKAVLTSFFCKHLEMLALALLTGKIILIKGGFCSGKNILATELARLFNLRYLVISMHINVDTTDLLGGFIICGNYKSNSLVNSISKKLNEILFDNDSIVVLKKNKFEIFQQCKNIEQFIDYFNIINQKDITKKIKELRVLFFEYQDIEKKEKILNKNEGFNAKFKFKSGCLIKAIKKGYLVIFNNINCAKPEVIERINCLGEENGQLFLFEFGCPKKKQQEIHKKHKDFRIICTYNPERKNSFNFSKPFLNRCIKINIENIENCLISNNYLIEKEEIIKHLMEVLLKKNLEKDPIKKNESKKVSILIDLHTQVLKAIKEKNLKNKYMEGLIYGFMPCLRSLEMLSNTIGTMNLEKGIDLVYSNLNRFLEINENDRRVFDAIFENKNNKSSYLNPKEINLLRENIVKKKSGSNFIKKLNSEKLFVDYLKKYIKEDDNIYQIIKFIGNSIRILSEIQEENIYVLNLEGKWIIPINFIAGVSIIPKSFVFDLESKNSKLTGDLNLLIQNQRILILKIEFDLFNQNKYYWKIKGKTESNFKGINLEKMASFVIDYISRNIFNLNVFKKSLDRITFNNLLLDINFNSNNDWYVNFEFKECVDKITLVQDYLFLKNIEFSKIGNQDASKIELKGKIFLKAYELVNNFEIDFSDLKNSKVIAKNSFKKTVKVKELVKNIYPNLEDKLSDLIILDKGRYKVEIFTNDIKIYVQLENSKLKLISAFNFEIFSITEIQVELIVDKKINLFISCCLNVLEQPLIPIKADLEISSESHFKYQIDKEKSKNFIKNAINALNKFLKNVLGDFEVIEKLNKVGIKEFEKMDIIYMDVKNITINFKVNFIGKGWEIIELIDLNIISIEFDLHTFEDNYNAKMIGEITIFDCPLTFCTEIQKNLKIWELKIQNSKLSLLIVKILKKLFFNCEWINFQAFENFLTNNSKEVKDSNIRFVKNNFSFNFEFCLAHNWKPLFNSENFMLENLSLELIKKNKTSPNEIIIKGKLIFFDYDLSEFNLHIPPNENEKLAIKNKFNNMEKIDLIKLCSRIYRLNNDDNLPDFNFPLMNHLKKFEFGLQDLSFDVLISSEEDWLPLKNITFLTINKVDFHFEGQFPLPNQEAKFSCFLNAELHIGNLLIKLKTDMKSLKELKLSIFGEHKNIYFIEIFDNLSKEIGIQNYLRKLKVFNSLKFDLFLFDFVISNVETNIKFEFTNGDWQPFDWIPISLIEISSLLNYNYKIKDRWSGSYIKGRLKIGKLLFNEVQIDIPPQENWQIKTVKAELLEKINVNDILKSFNLEIDYMNFLIDKFTLDFQFKEDRSFEFFEMNLGIEKLMFETFGIEIGMKNVNCLIKLAKPEKKFSFKGSYIEFAIALGKFETKKIKVELSWPIKNVVIDIPETNLHDFNMENLVDLFGNKLGLKINDFLDIFRKIGLQKIKMRLVLNEISTKCKVLEFDLKLKANCELRILETFLLQDIEVTVNKINEKWSILIGGNINIGGLPIYMEYHVHEKKLKSNFSVEKQLNQIIQMESLNNDLEKEEKLVNSFLADFLKNIHLELRFIEIDLQVKKCEIFAIFKGIDICFIAQKSPHWIFLFSGFKKRLVFRDLWDQLNDFDNFLGVEFENCLVLFGSKHCSNEKVKMLTNELSKEVEIKKKKNINYLENVNPPFIFLDLIIILKAGLWRLLKLEGTRISAGIIVENKNNKKEIKVFADIPLPEIFNLKLSRKRFLIETPEFKLEIGFMVELPSGKHTTHMELVGSIGYNVKENSFIVEAGTEKKWQDPFGLANLEIKEIMFLLKYHKMLNLSFTGGLCYKKTVVLCHVYCPIRLPVRPTQLFFILKEIDFIELLYDLFGINCPEILARIIPKIHKLFFVWKLETAKISEKVFELFSEGYPEIEEYRNKTLPFFGFDSDITFLSVRSRLQTQIFLENCSFNGNLDIEPIELGIVRISGKERENIEAQLKINCENIKFLLFFNGRLRIAKIVDVGVLVDCSDSGLRTHIEVEFLCVRLLFECIIDFKPNIRFFISATLLMELNLQNYISKQCKKYCENAMKHIEKLKNEIEDASKVDNFVDALAVAFKTTFAALKFIFKMRLDFKMLLGILLKSITDELFNIEKLGFDADFNSNLVHLNVFYKIYVSKQLIEGNFVVSLGNDSNGEIESINFAKHCSEKLLAEHGKNVNMDEIKNSEYYQDLKNIEKQVNAYTEKCIEQKTNDENMKNNENLNDKKMKIEKQEILLAKYHNYNFENLEESKLQKKSKLYEKNLFIDKKNADFNNFLYPGDYPYFLENLGEEIALQLKKINNLSEKQMNSISFGKILISFSFNYNDSFFVKNLFTLLICLNMLHCKYEVILTGDETSQINTPVLIKSKSMCSTPLNTMIIIYNACKIKTKRQKDFPKDLLEESADWIIFITNENIEIKHSEKSISDINKLKKNMPIGWMVFEKTKNYLKFKIQNNFNEFLDCNGFEEFLFRILGIKKRNNNKFDKIFYFSVNSFNENILKEFLIFIQDFIQKNHWKLINEKQMEKNILELGNQKENNYSEILYQQLNVYSNIISNLSLSNFPIEELNYFSKIWAIFTENLDCFIENLLSKLNILQLNSFSSYSDSTKGKILSIPGIMKWSMTKGSCNKIWRNRTSGGKFIMSICLLLDLTQSSRDFIFTDLLPSAVILIESFTKLNYSLSCAIQTQSKTIIVKLNDGQLWNDENKAKFILSIIDAFNDGEEGEIMSNKASLFLLGISLLNRDVYVGSNFPKKLLYLTSGDFIYKSNFYSEISNLVRLNDIQFSYITIGIFSKFLEISSISSIIWMKRFFVIDEILKNLLKFENDQLSIESDNIINKSKIFNFNFIPMDYEPLYFRVKDPTECEEKFVFLSGKFNYSSKNKIKFEKTIFEIKKETDKNLSKELVKIPIGVKCSKCKIQLIDTNPHYYCYSCKIHYCQKCGKNIRHFHHLIYIFVKNSSKLNQVYLANIGNCEIIDPNIVGCGYFKCNACLKNCNIVRYSCLNCPLKKEYGNFDLCVKCIEFIKTNWDNINQKDIYNDCLKQNHDLLTHVYIELKHLEDYYKYL